MLCLSVALLLRATAGFGVQEMIDLPWDGATTRVTLPARTYRGEGSDAGEMVVGKGGATRMVWVGDEPVDALVALPHRTGPVLAAIRSTCGLRNRSLAWLSAPA